MHRNKRHLCTVPFFFLQPVLLGSSGGSDGKKSACIDEDLGLIPGLGRSPQEGNGYLLQSSCLEDSMDRGDWRATVHGVAKGLGMAEQLTLPDFEFIKTKQ